MKKLLLLSFTLLGIVSHAEADFDFYLKPGHSFYIKPGRSFSSANDARTYSYNSAAVSTIARFSNNMKRADQLSEVFCLVFLEYTTSSENDIMDVTKNQYGSKVMNLKKGTRFKEMKLSFTTEVKDSLQLECADWAYHGGEESLCRKERIYTRSQQSFNFVFSTEGNSDLQARLNCRISYDQKVNSTPTRDEAAAIVRQYAPDFEMQ